MSEIRFLTSSDEHLTNVSPGFRRDDYESEILSMLEWQGTMAKKFAAHAVLRGGDLIHSKTAAKTPMRTLARAARIHRAYSCETFTVCGNHDLYHNDINSVNGQPLGVLLNADVLKPLHDEIFSPPGSSLRVRVIGVDYTPDLDTGGLCDLVKKKDEDFTIAVVHALASYAPEEKIQSFFNEKIFDYRDLVFNGCPDAYVFGHYHKDQGIQTHMGTHFVNLGAISRGALSFENITRQPKVSLIKINSQGVSIEECVVPHRDASEIFDFEKKKKLDTQRKNLDTFISQLRMNARLNEVQDLETRKKELSQFPDDLRQLCLQTLEAATEGVLEE